MTRSHTDIIRKLATHLDADVTFHRDGDIDVRRGGENITDADSEVEAIRELVALCEVRRAALVGSLDADMAEARETVGDATAQHFADLDLGYRVGRVYVHADGPIYVSRLSGEVGFVCCVDPRGNVIRVSKHHLLRPEEFTAAHDHPLATDPPRDDGLGWQDGDRYEPFAGHVRKLRGGKAVACCAIALPPHAAPIRYDGNYGPRLTFAPQWEAVTDEPGPEYSIEDGDFETDVRINAAGVVVVDTMAPGPDGTECDTWKLCRTRADVDRLRAALLQMRSRLPEPEGSDDR